MTRRRWQATTRYPAASRKRCISDSRLLPVGIRAPGLRAAVVGALVAAVALGAPAAAAAQAATGAAHQRLEGFLPADHWSRLAIRRAAASGLVGVSALGTPWSVRLSDVRGTVRDAMARGGGSVSIRASLEGIAARLESDNAPPPDGGVALDLRIDAGAAAFSGERLAGLAFPSEDGYDYTRPPTVPDSSGAIARASGFAGIGRVVAGFTVEARAHRFDVLQLDVSARAGPLDIRAGRQPLAFGPGAGEAVVLGPRASFDGVGLATPHPFALPSLLRHLGGVRASLLVARMDASGDVAHPWFAASRLSFEPSMRWAIGLNRATIFGGEGNAPVTARRLLLVLLGARDTDGKDSDFENQVASLDVAVRIGGPLALLGYAEVGIDDIGRALDRLPGVLAGIEANRIPGASRLAFGLELAGFVGSCCGFAPWYRHGKLAAGWSDGGRLLGHSLGGHGAESALTWRIDPAADGFLASGRLFIRHRGRDNVFAPDRAGVAAGGLLRFSLPLRTRFRIDADAGFETGDGWRQWTARVTLGRLFRTSPASPTLPAR